MTIPIEIIVNDKTPLEKAMKILKKKLMRENVFRDLKTKKAYEKPSRKKKRKLEDAESRRKKAKRRR